MTKVIFGPQISKAQSDQLQDVSDKVSKRAKNPEDYDATVQDVSEVVGLVESLDKAVDKIRKK